jgi:flagellin
VTRDAGNIPVAASVHIQAGDSGFPLSFSNLDKEFSNIFAKHPPSDPPAALEALSSLQRSAQSLADLYAGRAGSLQGQAASLQSQASILEEAAALRANTPAPVSTENLLLNLILRDGGGIFSGKG